MRWYTSACRMTDMKTAAEVAQSLKKIPRTVARCDIYGTTRVIVDRRHARNLLKKLVPWATSPDIYDALVILQDRLDHNAPARGWMAEEQCW